MSRWPYGTLFFQPGECFDCGICLHGIYTGSNVVRLTCCNSCVFHAECLRNQINEYGNKYCVLCGQAIVAKNPPAIEEPIINE